MKNKTFAEKAYKHTAVDFHTTQGKIVDMLAEINIHDVRITQHGEDYSIEFLVKMQQLESPRKVRMNVPFFSELGEGIRKSQQRKNTIFRVLYHHLKDKFVAVSNGLKEFEEEFLADLVIISNGKEQRLGDVIVPRYKKQLKDQKVAVISIN